MKIITTNYIVERGPDKRLGKMADFSRIHSYSRFHSNSVSYPFTPKFKTQNLYIPKGRFYTKSRDPFQDAPVRSKSRNASIAAIQSHFVPSRFRRLQSGFFCFRCGGVGHYAKFCKKSFCCFLCGEKGHKSFNCHNFKLASSIQFARKDSVSILEDLSWYSQKHQDLDSCNNLDIMFLDPDVRNCYHRVSDLIQDAHNSSKSLGLEDNYFKEIILSDSFIKVCNISFFQNISIDIARLFASMVLLSSSILSFTISYYGITEKALREVCLSNDLKCNVDCVMKERDCSESFNCYGSNVDELPYVNIEKITDVVREDYNLVIKESYNVCAIEEGACSIDKRLRVFFCTKAHNFILYCFFAALRGFPNIPQIASWNQQIHRGCMCGKNSRNISIVGSKKKHSDCLKTTGSVRRSPRLEHKYR